MKFKLPQWELPDHIANRIGGLRVMVAQTQWYFSLPQFLTIVGLLLYQNSQFIRSIPIIGESIFHWIAFMSVFFIGIFIFHYSIVFPSMQTFSQNQAQREERSPHYRQTLKNQEEIREIKEILQSAKNGDRECPICQDNLKNTEVTQ